MRIIAYNLQVHYKGDNWESDNSKVSFVSHPWQKKNKNIFRDSQQSFGALVVMTDAFLLVYDASTVFVDERQVIFDWSNRFFSDGHIIEALMKKLCKWSRNCFMQVLRL